MKRSRKEYMGNRLSDEDSSSSSQNEKYHFNHDQYRYKKRREGRKRRYGDREKRSRDLERTYGYWSNDSRSRSRSRSQSRGRGRNSGLGHFKKRRRLNSQSPMTTMHNKSSHESKNKSKNYKYQSLSRSRSRSIETNRKNNKSQSKRHLTYHNEQTSKNHSDKKEKETDRNMSDAHNFERQTSQTNPLTPSSISKVPSTPSLGDSPLLFTGLAIDETTKQERLDRLTTWRTKHKTDDLVDIDETTKKKDEGSHIEKKSNHNHHIIISKTTESGGSIITTNRRSPGTAPDSISGHSSESMELDNSDDNENVNTEEMMYDETEHWMTLPTAKKNHNVEVKHQIASIEIENIAKTSVQNQHLLQNANNVIMGRQFLPPPIPSLQNTALLLPLSVPPSKTSAFLPLTSSLSYHGFIQPQMTSLHMYPDRTNELSISQRPLSYCGIEGMVPLQHPNISIPSSLIPVQNSSLISNINIPLPSTSTSTSTSTGALQASSQLNKTELKIRIETNNEIKPISQSQPQLVGQVSELKQTIEQDYKPLPSKIEKSSMLQLINEKKLIQEDGNSRMMAKQFNPQDREKEVEKKSENFKERYKGLGISANKSVESNITVTTNHRSPSKHEIEMIEKKNWMKDIDSEVQNHTNEEDWGAPPDQLCVDTKNNNYDHNLNENSMYNNDTTHSDLHMKPRMSLKSMDTDFSAMSINQTVENYNRNKVDATDIYTDISKESVFEKWHGMKERSGLQSGRCTYEALIKIWGAKYLDDLYYPIPDLRTNRLLKRHDVQRVRWLEDRDKRYYLELRDQVLPTMSQHMSSKVTSGPKYIKNKIPSLHEEKIEEKENKPRKPEEESKTQLINFLYQYITDIEKHNFKPEEKKQLAIRISEKVLHGYNNMKHRIEWKHFFQQRYKKIQEFCNTYLRKYKMKLRKQIKN